RGRLDRARAPGELPGDAAVRRADALALRQVMERLGERPRRRAEPLAQVDDRELQDALLSRFLVVLRGGGLDEALPIQPAQELRGALVQVRLGARQLHLGLARPARRQVQVVDHTRAPGADHDFMGERSETLWIPGLALIALDEVRRPELRPGAELAGPQQRDEVVQLAQIVLQWRGGEEQDEVPLDLLDEPVGRAALALHFVRLVDDTWMTALSRDVRR